MRTYEYKSYLTYCKFTNNFSVKWTQCVLIKNFLKCNNLLI